MTLLVADGGSITFVVHFQRERAVVTQVFEFLEKAVEVASRDVAVMTLLRLLLAADRAAEHSQRRPV